MFIGSRLAGPLESHPPKGAALQSSPGTSNGQNGPQVRLQRFCVTSACICMVQANSQGLYPSTLCVLFLQPLNCAGQAVDVYGLNVVTSSLNTQRSQLQIFDRQRSKLYSRLSISEDLRSPFRRLNKAARRV